MMKRTYNICLTCGKAYKESSPEKNCDECYQKYLNGITYNACNKCNKKYKAPSKYGLCFTCYKELMEV